jgi:hypothetical protein
MIQEVHDMTDVVTPYDIFKHGDRNILVEAARRDADGYLFSEAYPKKISQDIIINTNSSTRYKVAHRLGVEPSAVTLYMRKLGKIEFVKIGADISADEDNIYIRFPDSMVWDDGTTLLIKALI